MSPTVASEGSAASAARACSGVATGPLAPRSPPGRWTSRPDCGRWRISTSPARATTTRSPTTCPSTPPPTASSCHARVGRLRVDERLVDERAHPDPAVVAAEEHLREEEHGDVGGGINPERRAGRALPAVLAGRRERLGRDRVDERAQSEPEAVPLVDDEIEQRPAELGEGRVAREVVGGHQVDRPWG